MHNEHYMSRAFRLAALARHASPNPAVGCVCINAAGRLVGEGSPARTGRGPGQANALLAAGQEARGATGYVPLEACFPFPEKRTPPCSESLVAAGVSAVKV